MKLKVEVDQDVFEFLEWYIKTVEKKSFSDFIKQDLLSGIDSQISVRRTHIMSFEKNGYVTIPEKFDGVIEKIKDL